MSLELLVNTLSRPLDAGVDPLWRHQPSLLLESTGKGIFGIDLDGRRMFIHRAGAEPLGHDPAALIGRNMHETTHHSHAGGAPYPTGDCPIFNAFRQGLPRRIDSEVFWRRDGSAFAVAYSSRWSARGRSRSRRPAFRRRWRWARPSGSICRIRSTTTARTRRALRSRDRWRPPARRLGRDRAQPAAARPRAPGCITWTAAPSCAATSSISWCLRAVAQRPGT